MNLYRNTFPNKHTLLTVVHCVDEDQAARNMRIAQKAGADGAFPDAKRHGESHGLA